MELKEYYDKHQIELLTDFGINISSPLDRDSLVELEKNYYDEIMELAKEWYMESKE